MSWSAQLLVGGARIVLIVVFALATMEKVGTLAKGSAAWHPVMVAHPRLRHLATHLIGASIMADLAIIALLSLSPRLAGAISIVIVSAYSLAGLNTHSVLGSSECRCLWRILNPSTRRGFGIRNAMLIGLAAVLILSSAPEWSIGGVVAGAALLLLISVTIRLGDRIRHASLGRSVSLGVLATPSPGRPPDIGQLPRGRERGG